VAYTSEMTWDLEGLCPGGPDGDAFIARRAALRERWAGLHAEASQLGALGDAPDAWRDWVRAAIEAGVDLDELQSLSGCWYAAHGRTTAARMAHETLTELSAQVDSAYIALDTALAGAAEPELQAWLADPALDDAAPLLRHRRDGARLKLPGELESLAVKMEREALTGWGQLYQILSGRLTGTLVLGEERSEKGVGELGALRAHADESVRRAAHEALGGAWSSVAPQCALTLTHITGSRQTRYDRTAVGPMAQTVHGNRTPETVIDALWVAADALAPTLHRYLARKATLLGKPALDWWDVDAPLPGRLSSITWPDAQRTVVEALSAFHPEYGAFAEQALRERWVEAEPRDEKRPGGFCTDLPRSRQSRIFMTFVGTLDNTMTLAHELGHAYHNKVLFEAPPTLRSLTMNLAESASTFFEAIVLDQILATTTDPQDRAFLLDQQLQAGVAFLMNIPARFRFEEGLHRWRREGPLQPDQLSARMVTCQRAAYGDALASWSPMFWASKLHFYISSFGFYNWPYTFGYLFSAAIHRRAAALGPDGPPFVRELLLRTGWQDVLSLGHDVFGADLADPAFWIDAAAPLRAQADAFIDATDPALGSNQPSPTGRRS
jgi:oligoendopeptidase F